MGGAVIIVFSPEGIEMVGTKIDTHSVNFYVEEEIQHGKSAYFLNSIIRVCPLQHEFIGNRKEFPGFKFGRIMGIETYLDFGFVVKNFALPIRGSPRNQVRRCEERFVLRDVLVLNCGSQIKFSIGQ